MDGWVTPAPEAEAAAAAAATAAAVIEYTEALAELCFGFLFLV